ncbi:MAG: response regulator [Gammaproteobacteria bacterium]|nr:response regulator [Gammaproteobacteria bacterium]
MDEKRLSKLKQQAETSMLNSESSESSEFNAKNLHDISVYKAELEAQFTELLDTEAALDKANRSLSLVLNSAPFGLLTIDNKFNIQLINEHACSLLDVSAHRVTNHNVLSLFNGANNKETVISWLLNPLEDKLELLFSDHCHLAMKKVELAEDQILISISDVTAEREATKELLGQKQKAEAEILAQRNFVARVSHELRTPFNSVLGILQILRDEMSEQTEQKALVDRGIEESKELLVIINELLDYAAINSGVRKPIYTNARLQSVFDKFIDKVSEAFNSADNTLEIDYHLCHDTYKLDVEGLAHIAINLLTNANKYTEQGHVQVSITTDSSEDIGIDLLTLSIKDNGRGIAKEDLELVFSEYFRSREANDNQIQGVGLGLSIVKELVNKMGGEIRVISQLGVGSEFIVSMPLKRAHTSDLSSDTSPSKSLQTPNLEGKTIYTVDDNPLNLEVIYRMLLKTGAKVERFVSASKLLERALSQAPDIIFTDIQMPDIDGVQLLKMSRREKLTIPIIAVTANADPVDHDYYRTVGFNDVLLKPIELHQIYSKLNSLLLS